LADEDLSEQLVPMILDLIRDSEQREIMSRKMQSLAFQDAAGQIAVQLTELAQLKGV
jgi:UDP-N-acetylglucosamine:LPS N-acetylglucosamine transferase